MARRRQEIALQTEIETQEEWNETVNKEGLTVIDVYQQWAGSCKSVEGNFKRIKIETGESLLKFALAKADTIDSLEKHRGRCEPCFLFYASGVLVDAVVGANAPELQRKILLNLEREKKILKEGGERIEFRFDHAGDEDEGDDTGPNRGRSPSIVNAVASQQYTLAVIRPDVYADGKADEIVDKIKQQAFKVLLQQERHLNDHDARELHRYKMNEEGYEEHITRMTSGPSIALLLQKTDAKDSSVDDFRELVNSDETLKSTVDCTQSIDHIQHELMLLFPNIAQRAHSPLDKPLERTMAVIRPSALKIYKDAIIKRIQDSGFDILRTTESQLTKDQAEAFYADKKNEPYFQDLIQEMISGPSLALYLIKRDAVQGFRTLLGPTEKNEVKDATRTLRNEFDLVDVKINSIHGPRTRAEVNHNLQFFFPEERIFVILKPNLTDQQRSEIKDTFKKAGFFIMADKVEKLTPEQVAQLHQSHQGTNHYDELVNYMTSGPSELLVLVKENASKSWQELVGPEEPAKASETAPTSLRAMYGKDLIHNAIDVSPTVEKAQNDIHLIFGDIDQEEQAYMEGKSIDNSLSVTPDINNEPLQLDTDTNEA